MSLGTPPMEAEVASAVESILDKSQPMDVDPALAEHSYEMFQDDALGLLGMAKGLDSPMTAREDRVLDMPARFSRAPGDGRPTTESSAGATGHKITRTHRAGRTFTVGIWKKDVEGKMEGTEGGTRMRTILNLN